jgi:hypothetical protein
MSNNAEIALFVLCHAAARMSMRRVFESKKSHAADAIDATGRYLEPQEWELNRDWPIKPCGLQHKKSRFPAEIRVWKSPKLLDSLTSGHYGQRVLKGVWDVPLQLCGWARGRVTAYHMTFRRTLLKLFWWFLRPGHSISKQKLLLK